MSQSAEHRRSPRVEITLPCTLRRPVGRPIVAKTLNVSAGGMLVSSARPLALDETLDFDLADLDVPVSGHAHVQRHHQRDVYALRFERLPEPMTSCLWALVTH